ncbi:MAG TPA: class I SAM-dependent methyltransferase [Gemmatimonadaceae bacterium]|nr:class I SAM-dependent methyltransferase [Gemmatimonadaceae bacterium]
MDPLSDAKIIDSWRKNAAPWTDAVRESRIESRALVTNQAIIDAVMSRSPRTALDIGCGEGWLVRELAGRGVRATGVDAVPALVEQAARAGGGEFRVASYEAIAAGELHLAVDVAVANFSLIGKDAVDALVRRVPALLSPRGAFIVQTLHPLVASGDQPYRDGWRAGSWAGFGAEFTDPAPWYFRTLESWVALLVSSGLRLVELREPPHPATGKPASVVLVAEASG